MLRPKPHVVLSSKGYGSKVLKPKPSIIMKKQVIEATRQTVLLGNHFTNWRRIMEDESRVVHTALLKSNVHQFGVSGYLASRYIVQSNHQMIILNEGGLVTGTFNNGRACVLMHDKPTTIILPHLR